MRYWFVNKKGFISLYALTLLSITLLCSIYITSLITTQYKTQQFSYIDVYILHCIKTYLQQEEVEVIQESLQWKSYHITFTYEEEKAIVFLSKDNQNYQMVVYYNKDDKTILHYTYL